MDSLRFISCLNLTVPVLSIALLVSHSYRTLSSSLSVVMRVNQQVMYFDPQELIASNTVSILFELATMYPFGMGKALPSSMCKYSLVLQLTRVQ